jgi:DNA polymerase-3 subunit beta
MDIVFTVERDELEKAVSRIITVCERTSVEGRNTLPYFFHIRIDGYGEALKLSAGNAIRNIEILLPKVSKHEPFCFGVFGSYFHNILKALPGGDLTFTLRDVCFMHNGSSTLKFQILPSDQFPAEDIREDHVWWEIDYKELFSKLKKITYCIDSQGVINKSYVKSVHVSPQYFLCTDNRRLSMVPNEMIPYGDNFLIPAESVQSFSSLFDSSSSRGFVYTDGCKLHFSQGHTHASTRLLSYDAPSFDRAIPKGACTSCDVDKNVILMSTKRALVVAKKGQSKDKLQPVSLAFSANKLRMFLENNGFGITENMDIIYSGPDMEVHMDLTLLYQAIKNITEDVIRIEMRGDSTPFVITDSNREHINVIMPVIVRR